MPTKRSTPVRQVKCKSGIRGWRGRLKDQYENLGEFDRADTAYNLAKRLGYATAFAAWDANPLIEGSVNPGDYRKVATPPPQVLEIYLYRGDSEHILVLNEGQDFEAIISEWEAMDHEYVKTGGKKPDNWEPISDYLKHRGVVVIDPKPFHLR